METLALIAAVITGVAVLTTVLRCEAEQRHVKIYTDASYRATFGGVK